MGLDGDVGDECVWRIGECKWCAVLAFLRIDEGDVVMLRLGSVEVIGFCLRRLLLGPFAVSPLLLPFWPFFTKLYKRSSEIFREENICLYTNAGRYELLGGLGNFLKHNLRIYEI